MNLEKYFTLEYEWFQSQIKELPDTVLSPDNLPEGYMALWRNMASDRGFVGIYPHMNSKKVNTHSHDFFEFLFVYKGNCKIRVDNTDLMLKEKDICILNLQANHSIDSVDIKENIIYYIMINPVFFKSTYFQLSYIESKECTYDFFLESIANQCISNNFMLFTDNKNTEMERLITHVIYENYNNKIHKTEMMNFLMSAFLIEVSREYVKYITLVSQNELGDYPITEIIDYIYGHYKTITLKQVAKHFNYSSSYLSILIKKYSGINFTEMLHTFRIIKFCQLLIETDSAISELILEVGCNNKTWFIKKFKERYLISPSEYRRKYK